MKYDLLLTGGEVLDPAAGLRGVMDIGIAGGKIVAVAPSLPPAEARRTISAKGRLVTPGLVDIHAHIFVNAHDMAGDTDRFCRASGVTTLCDAGSTGSATFAGLRQIIDREVRTRTRAFVNLSAIGIVGTARGGELAHFPYADPEGCARTISENPDLAIGVKLRYGPGLVWEYIDRAGQAGAPDRGYGRRRADDDAHHQFADPVARIARPHEARRHRHPLLSRPRPRHHGPGKAIGAEGSRRGAAPRHHLRLRPRPKPFQLSDDREGARPGLSARHDLDRPDLHQRHPGAGMGSADDDVETAAFRHVARRCR